MSCSEHRLRSAQSGFTLIETLMAVSLCALLMLPILGWGLMATREQVDTSQRNRDAASIGLLRTYFVKDVASARGVLAGAAANGSDCSGGEGAATAANQTILRLRGSGNAVIVYNLTTSSDGQDLSVYRRECDGSTFRTSAEMVQRLAPSGATATCSARPNAPTGDCGRVNLRVATVDAELVSMTASMRGGTAITVSNPGPTYQSPDVMLTVTGVESDPGYFAYRGDWITFDASGSTDPGGRTLSYHWDFGDGTTSTAEQVTHQYVGLGQRTAVLTVTNSDGTPSSDYVRIEIRNHPPTARISAPVGAVSINLCSEVSFAGVGSNDDDDGFANGIVTSYEWAYGDGGSSTRPNATSHNYQYRTPSPSSGPFEARLIVVDNDGGRSAAATRDVTVTNRAPTATIRANGITGSITATSGVPINFTSGASDPDTVCGDSLSYSWTFGDGTTSTEANPMKTYGTTANRTVSLTVTDRFGGSVTRTFSIIGNTSPIAAFTVTPSPVRAGELVTFPNTSSDPDGTPQSGLGHVWTFTNLGAGYSSPSTSQNPGSVRFTHNVGSADTFTEATYNVGLTVTDPQGATGTTTRQVVVRGAPAPAGVAHAFSRVCNGTFLGICTGYTNTNRISWSAVSSVTSYQVWLTRSYACGFLWLDTCTDNYYATPTATNQAFVNQYTGQTWQVRVRAQDTYTGKWGFWSEPISASFGG